MQIDISVNALMTFELDLIMFGNDFEENVWLYWSIIGAL